MYKITIPGRPVPKARPRLGVKGRTAYIYTAAGCKPVKAPVAVVLNVYIKCKLDADNIAKSVLDGLNGIAYEDDEQVVELLVRKHKVKAATDERVEIEIRKAG